MMNLIGSLRECCGICDALQRSKTGWGRYPRDSRRSMATSYSRGFANRSNRGMPLARRVLAVKARLRLSGHDRANTSSARDQRTAKLVCCIVPISRTGDMLRQKARPYGPLDSYASSASPAAPTNTSLRDDGSPIHCAAMTLSIT